MDEIDLPRPKIKGTMSLEETIQKRRSVRQYSSKELSLEEISQLVWSAQGITGRRGGRSAPSAGALYPLEIYIISKDGFFHYIPEGHKLVKKHGKDIRAGLRDASLGQNFVGQAPVSVIITAVYRRVSSRYGKRGERYTDIEVGHAAENVHLQAVALGLASVPVGAFDDDKVARLLGLSSEEKPLYIIPVGHEI